MNFQPFGTLFGETCTQSVGSTERWYFLSAQPSCPPADEGAPSSTTVEASNRTGGPGEVVRSLRAIVTA